MQAKIKANSMQSLSGYLKEHIEEIDERLQFIKQASLLNELAVLGYITTAKNLRNELSRVRKWKRNQLNKNTRLIKNQESNRQIFNKINQSVNVNQNSELKNKSPQEQKRMINDQLAGQFVDKEVIHPAFKKIMHIQNSKKSF